jgi:hypothetical protein
METITHICDICKQSKGKEELARLEIRSSGLEFLDRYATIKVDICKSCLEKKNFIVNSREDKTLKEIQNMNNKNLEDKIIDILNDLGVQFYE